MRRFGFYDPIRDSYPDDPFQREYPHLRIHYLGRRDDRFRSYEEWEIRPRNSEDLEQVTMEVIRFYASRRPFMEQDSRGKAIGDIGIRSVTQDEINLSTNNDPTQKEMMDRIESLLRSGFDHIDVMGLIFRLHLRVGLIARAGGTTDKQNGVQDVDGGSFGECLLRAIFIHCLQFEDCRQILSIKNRPSHGSTAKPVCLKLNRPGMSNIHRGYAKLKELIGDRIPIVSAGFFNHIVSLFPSIQIAVWFHNRHYTQSDLPCCGAEHDDPKKTLHLIYKQREQHVQIICDWDAYLGDGRKGVCDGCCVIFPKLTTKKQKPMSQASFNVPRDKYLESHSCKGISTLDSHTCVGTAKCLCCLRIAAVCARHNINQIRLEDPLKCPTCDMEAEYEQCLRYHLEHSACKPQYTECGNCGFKGNEANVKRHECYKRHCNKCKETRPAKHDCYFPKDRKLKNQELKDEQNEDSFEIYYALDIESVLNPTNEFRTIPVLQDGVVVDRQVPIALHEINLIVIQQMMVDKKGDVTNEVTNFHILFIHFFQDGTEPVLFYSFDDFYEWLSVQPTEQTKYYFYAHNNSRYDGQMLFNAYMKKIGVPPRVQWSGQRIRELSFQTDPKSCTYFNFRDSMYHIGGPLKNFTKTFGLPPEAKKGFFPYNLNSMQNIVYPDIPDISHFEPDSLPVSTRNELMAWHDSMKGKPYDLQKELEDYCKQDVLILKWGLETYIRDAKAAGSFNPLKKTTIAAYCLALYQTLDYDPHSFPIHPLEIDQEQFVQQAFHGGRTDVRCRYYKAEPGDRILYIDVVSLYPTVQVFDPMPYGLPRWQTFDDFNQEYGLNLLKEFYGFAEIDYQVVGFHFHPVCTLLVDGKLQADLLDKEQIVETSCKIQWMLARPHLYRITKIHRILHYKKTDDMFVTYMNRCLKGKCLSAETIDDPQKALDRAIQFRDRSDGRLDFVKDVENGAQFKKNPGLKTLCKLQANNLWGKFGQRDNEEYTVVRQLNPLEYQRACEYELDGQLRFVHPPLYYRNAEQEVWLCALEGPMKNAPIFKQIFKSGMDVIRNKAVAAMVTAHAQLRLLAAMEVLGERVLYHDTDSIVCVLKEGEELPPEIVIGECLGEWEMEHPTPKEGRITEFVAIGPKAYGLRFEYPDKSIHHILKTKGCNLTSYRNQHVDFDKMVEMVKDEHVAVPVFNLDIRSNRAQNAVKSSTQAKMIRATDLKGEQVGFRVFPFGYDRFDEGLLEAMKYA